MSSIDIRSAVDDDLEYVTDLCGQLGYASTEDETRSRLGSILSLNDHAVFVAQLKDGPLVGWIHVFEGLRVESSAFAELGGFVVDEGHRGRGFGRQLLEHTEAWATKRGLSKLRVRSRSSRAEAHAFYTGVGFAVTKQQSVFDKALG